MSRAKEYARNYKRTARLMAKLNGRKGHLKLGTPAPNRERVQELLQRELAKPARRYQRK